MILDIKYINELLQEGKSVKDIRTILQIGEKSFQKQIKKMNYKYNKRGFMQSNDKLFI